MDNTVLYFIIALILTTMVCFVVLSVYIVKLLISITKLSNDADSIVNSVAKEIEPTLKELQQAAKSINSIANSADEKFQSTKAGLASFIGTTACLGGKLKNFTQGILKGLSFGLGLFRR